MKSVSLVLTYHRLTIASQRAFITRYVGSEVLFAWHMLAEWLAGNYLIK